MYDLRFYGNFWTPSFDIYLVLCKRFRLVLVFNSRFLYWDIIPTLYWCQKWDMAQFNGLLREITPEQEWSTERLAGILPTLLPGKLVDHYVELDTTTRKDLNQLKTVPHD